MSEQLLVAQNEALDDFLDDLLSEDTEEANLPVEETADDSPPVVMDAATVTPALELESESEVIETSAVVEMACDSDYLPAQGHARVPILPDWGLRPFQAMVFKVGELSLAIPVTELAEVIEWSPGAEGRSSDGLCLGHFEHHGQSTAVVDIARLIFAGSQLDTLLVTDAAQRVSRIILINSMKFGLAVDSVSEVITIQPTRVNWRSTRTRRQWLAGTMLDEMIVVLDAQSTIKILSGMLATSV